jgi:hypothetical protein
LELLQKKNNRTGIIVSVAIHLFLLLLIFFSRGCMEIQNPPQFTLEEVITIDFSDAGGGSPGSSAPKPTESTPEIKSEKEVTQEESPVTVNSSKSKTSKKEPDAEEVVESEKEPSPKNDFSNLFGKGSGDSKSGNGEGEGTGIGTGKGPNTGGGIGDGKGRQVIGNPELSNPKNWVGFVMVQFVIDPDGNVLDTKVLYPHNKTSVTLTSLEQKYIENDCKFKFKFTPSTSGISKERLVKRIQYIEK